MFLKKLTVTGANGIIREVEFKNGLNLILDESVELKTESGNSIGKTTTLRVIDFCLGSDGKDIYTDQEFKNINQEVYDFLTRKNVVFILELSRGKRHLKLERSFNSDPEIFKINEESCSSEKEYRKRLKEMLLKNKANRPTVRELMPKFIRKDTHSMSHTLKFVHSHTTRESYEVIHLFLFGFGGHELLSEKLRLLKKQKDEKGKKDAITNKRTLKAAQNIVTIVNHKIEKLESQIAGFQVADTYEKEMDRLSEIRKIIAEKSTQISGMKTQMKFNESTLTDLQKRHSDVDPITIQEIYEQAQHYISQLQKSFEDVLGFHNSMITKKAEFIQTRLEKLKAAIITEKNVLRSLLEKERAIMLELSATGSLSDLQKMQKELNELFEKKGQEENLVIMIEDIDSNLEDINTRLNEIIQALQDNWKELDSRIEAFNLIFSEYSEKLYGKGYILYYQKKNNVLEFNFENVAGNVGGGKKKGQIAAFDLAYLKFLADMNSQMFRFVMHDSIEDVHDHQLETLFEIANSIDGQYVISVLSRSVEFLGNDFIEKNKILGLSEKDMFFRF